MYNDKIISKLVEFISENNGINDKNKLSELVQEKFNLVQDRRVFTCEAFSIRFNKAESKRMSNTVLSLSALQKYDSKPFLVCIVSSKENYLLLANSTFLKKISHSSHELRTDNIKGSFNGSDIMLIFQDYENNPKNFKKLYEYHQGLSFRDNLERLVESTNGVVGRVQKFEITDKSAKTIYESVDRAMKFVQSPDYKYLNDDLCSRVKDVQNEIAIAAFIDNVNIRGRVIEYLITDDGSTLKDKIIDSLRNKKPLVDFRTEDKLGDYSKEYKDFKTETDIKTKVLFLNGNPKAYNIDKLLEFLAQEKSVYMIFLLGIDNDGKITSRLCSVFDKRLLESTNITHHWAGRNSRGVAQFIGEGLNKILSENKKISVDVNMSKDFLTKIINR